MSNNRTDPSGFPIAIFGPAFAWLLGLAYVLSLDDPRLRFPSYVAAIGLAGLGWLGLIRAAHVGPWAEPSLRKGSWAQRTFVLLVALGIFLRIVALGLPPAFSEDVFRYVYEGRAVWYYGWAFPFAHAPATAPVLNVDPALLDEAWLRINHPELSTIYPPFAQATFVAAAGVGELIGGGHLWTLKAVLVAADLAVWWLVIATLRHQGRPIALSLMWGLSPLVILEVAREGHADSLSALGLALGIYGFASARPRIGYVGWALATLAKLNGLIAMPAAVRTIRRGVWIGAALTTLVAVPYLFAGGTSSAGLSAYASRWRAGDGAFTVLLEISGGLLGGDWARIDALGITLTRHQLARILVAGTFAIWSVIVLVPRADTTSVPARAGWLLLGVLLLSPTLHPWYVLWILPFAAAAAHFEGRNATLLLALLVPALHHPGWLELIGGEWKDLAWVRAGVHLPVWMALLAAFATSRRTG